MGLVVRVRWVPWRVAWGCESRHGAPPRPRAPLVVWEALVLGLGRANVVGASVVAIRGIGGDVGSRGVSRGIVGVAEADTSACICILCKSGRGSVAAVFARLALLSAAARLIVGSVSEDVVFCVARVQG